MKGYQKSSPNLKFLQPQLTARQPKRTDSINLRFDVQKKFRTNQTENSMSIDKIYQITPSRVLTLKNMSRVMKSNFIHKTEPNETFDKQNIDNQRMLSRKQTAPKLIYRPIIKQNSEVFCMKDSPRIIQNTSMQESNSIYYISDVVTAFESKENYFNKLFKEHFLSSCMALKQCVNSKIIYKPKPVIIQNNPQNIKKYTLLFDLDETLVHCTLDMKLPCDKKLIIKLSQDETFQVGVSVRPGLHVMLELLEPNFEIIVFTASHGQYAKRIVEYIDPKRIISRVLSREHCCFTDQGQYVKDLSIIKNLPISRTLLVDNSAISYLCQLDNGVPIIPYYDNKQDKQLLQLAIYLNGMVGANDLREQNQTNLKNYLFAQLQTQEQVLEMYKVLHYSKKN
ncbi:unnamed protein product (macronuclear) [Paramecium tetraurelia]|uniref:FCP1 homology domain-containing protein n=1 Tax=Paramecium tetraurelia TaxID=5888 RepID=A0BJB2_PARTE|nr:uncharacterized protein GSPATT00005002001 [Paramecium tetraurelia]CAK58629.1 unnamed protein product [Paramecium tetraurelia]|eukprot:XP_001426027.1 hypothetical protein (macronuclear) [Paramecium tetraurelia strain d4-2]